MDEGKPIVEVHWRDTAAITDGPDRWMTRAELLREAEKLYGEVCITVGKLIEENERFLVVAATFEEGGEDPLGQDASMILRSSVVEVKELTRHDKQT